MGALKKFGWYLRLVAVFARASLRAQLQYRLNFVAGFCVESAYMMIKMIYLVVVLQSEVNIGELTPDMVMIFVGTYMFMTGIWMLLAGVISLPSNVVTGKLDTIMTKPGSLMFLQTFGQFNFAMLLPNAIAGITLICLGWVRAEVVLTFPVVAGFLFFILLSVALTYAFCLIPSLLVFWVTSLGGTFTLFAALWDFNNMPMTLYNNIARQIGTFVVPIFLLTNWPGLFVLDMLSPIQFAWGIAAPVLLILLARFMLRRGMRRYMSANG